MDIVGDTVRLDEVVEIAERVTGKRFDVNRLGRREMEKQLETLVDESDMLKRMWVQLKIMMLGDEVGCFGCGVLNPVANKLCPGVRAVSIEGYLTKYWGGKFAAIVPLFHQEINLWLCSNLTFRIKLRSLARSPKDICFSHSMKPASLSLSSMPCQHPSPISENLPRAESKTQQTPNSPLRFWSRLALTPSSPRILHMSQNSLHLRIRHHPKRQSPSSGWVQDDILRVPRCVLFSSLASFEALLELCEFKLVVFGSVGACGAHREREIM